MDEMDNPQAAEPIEQQPAEAPEQDLIDNDQTIEDGEQSEQPEDEAEDVEFEGKQYKLPKELKDALLRQSDYTRKTQEVAEQRRLIETQAQEVQRTVQLQQATIQEQAHLMAIDQQLAQFQALDWDNLISTDPQQAMRLQHQLQSLQGMRGQVTARINQVAQEQSETQRQSAAKRLESSSKAIASEIKGWSEESARDTAEYIKQHERLGITESDFARLNSGEYGPVPIIWAHKARLYDQLMAKAQTKPKTPAQEPVPTVKAKAPAGKDPERMSTEEWMRHREQQTRKRRA